MLRSKDSIVVTSWQVFMNRHRNFSIFLIRLMNWIALLCEIFTDDVCCGYLWVSNQAWYSLIAIWFSHLALELAKTPRVCPWRRCMGLFYFYFFQVWQAFHHIGDVLNLVSCNRGPQNIESIYDTLTTGIKIATIFICEALNSQPYSVSYLMGNLWPSRDGMSVI